jgi:type I restriction enzyme S subunit
LLEEALFGDSALALTTLGDHIQTRKNKGIPSLEPGAKYLGLEHVEAHGGRALGFDSAGKYRSSSPIVEKGDLLYGRLRPYLNKVVISPERLYVSGEFIVMEPSKTLETSFLKYLLMSPRFLAFTALLDTGDRPRVSWDKIANFQFQLPDLDGQKRIVDQIESALAVTASMQEDFENLKKLSHNLRRSLLNTAFSGKL